jgi:hypothetical protein
MRSIHRAYSRALITTATTGAALSIALLSGAGVASAHVHVDADDAAPGSTSVLTFRVPGESEKGALTTGFTVMLPNVASASTPQAPSDPSHGRRPPRSASPRTSSPCSTSR